MDIRQPVRPALPKVYLARDHGAEAVRAGIREGRLVRVRPGAYVDTVEDEAPWARRERFLLARCVAVARQLGPGHVVSHTAAALMHGLRLWRIDDAVHVSQEGTVTNQRSPFVERHRAVLPADDVTMVGGIRVTSVERTIEDCALTLHPRDALVVLDSAMRLLTQPDRWRRPESDRRAEELRWLLSERLEARATRRGKRTARSVLAHADPFAESAPESVLRWIAVSRGLPRPVSQFRVTTGRGTFFSDMGWTVERVAPVGGRGSGFTVHAEFDGRVKYRGADGSDGADAARAVVDEKLREDALREMGDRVRRFVTEDLGRPARTFERLCSAFPPGVTKRLRPVPELMPPPGRAGEEG